MRLLAVCALVVVCVVVKGSGSEAKVEDGKVIKSAVKDFKDELDEELHNAYETDGKTVDPLSDDDYKETVFGADVLPNIYEEKDDEDEEDEEDDEDEDYEEEQILTPSPPGGLPSLGGFPSMPGLPFLPPPWFFGGPWFSGAPQFFSPQVAAPEPYLQPIASSEGIGAPAIHIPGALPQGAVQVPVAAYPAEANYPMMAVPHPAAPSRRRRGAPELVDTVEVKDVDQWYYDVDAGFGEDEVGEALMKYKGYATYRQIDKQMQHYAPALHIGKINTGYLKNPELAHPSDRVYGKGFDFNAEDLEGSFEFGPKGQHIGFTHKELEKYVKRGKLPVGQLFYISKKLVNRYSICWASIMTKKVEKQRMVDVFSVASRRKYYRKENCDAFKPGVYKFVGLKKSFEREESTHGYETHFRNKNSNYVIFLKGTEKHVTGLRYIAISDFNPAAIQENSPVVVKTAYHKKTEIEDDDSSFHDLVTEKYRLLGPSVGDIFNSEDTVGGVKQGLKKYAPIHTVAAPYDNSIYFKQTGDGPQHFEHDPNHFAEVHNPHVVLQPHTDHNPVKVHH